MSDKVQPYFYKAQATFDAEDITIATLVTHNRFQVLSRLASHYKGPISAAVHVTDVDPAVKLQVLKDLDSTMTSNPDMQQYVDVHLIVDTHDRQFNMWRNVAKLFAPTEYIMMLDVDFMICTDLRQSLNEYPELKDLLHQGKAAVVVPAFEYVNPSDGEDWKAFPTTKKELIEKHRNNNQKTMTTTHSIDMFHRTWTKGHGATNYTHWYQAKAPYKVTTYNYSYEPYVIMKKSGTPWCDERFVGYGANKAACLYEIYLSGIDYWVLPNDFLIHQTHHYPEETRDRERKYNRKLYTHYREEICMRYGRIMKAKGSWDSAEAVNLKRECGKVHGFMSAVKKIES
ncbi:glycosyl-transferase for dystroglycan-domain-containing protein [Dichotomocladium elegans]|nr:glycosyl-transferase for dystroglycan-domain-containing protein [Dichotomocladium elegans]